MRCFTDKIQLFTKEKTLKLNNYGSHFKVYSHVLVVQKSCHYILMEKLPIY